MSALRSRPATALAITLLLASCTRHAIAGRLLQSEGDGADDDDVTSRPAAVPAEEGKSVAHFPQDSFQSAAGQDKYVYTTFFQSRASLQNRGVFVEFGGLDGEFHSNTYFFGKELGWRGLMVEADVRFFKDMQFSRRQDAIPVFGALTDQDNGHVDFSLATFPGWSGLASSYSSPRQANLETKVSVPTHRLETLLSLAGLKCINFMSVDTEGSELAILQTIPFDRIRIEVVMVEVLVLHSVGRVAAKVAEQEKANYKAIVSHMRGAGYHLVHDFRVADDTRDLMFALESMRGRLGADPEGAVPENDFGLWAGAKKSITSRSQTHYSTALLNALKGAPRRPVEATQEGRHPGAGGLTDEIRRAVAEASSSSTQALMKKISGMIGALSEKVEDCAKGPYTFITLGRSMR